MQAVNWNTQEDYVNRFWNQNIMQFWVDTEFPISDDIASWNALTPDERDVFTKVLAGLTGLDTQQGGEGMPLLSVHTPDLRKRSVLSFMGMMEQIHAKSYSTIFTTLIPQRETAYLLDEWVKSEPHLEYKSHAIGTYYRALLDRDPSRFNIYMAHVASVALESALFFSGFYYPLYLSGTGRMSTSGEVIRKILIDESIHGLYVGQLAQELYADFTDSERALVRNHVETMFDNLLANEVGYTRAIYDKIGLSDDVIRYVKYNFDKALMVLGFEARYLPAPFNPVVENGLSTKTTQHDFFSKKGDSYVLSVNSEPFQPGDFIFA